MPNHQTAPAAKPITPAVIMSLIICLLSIPLSWGADILVAGSMGDMFTVLYTHYKLILIYLGESLVWNHFFPNKSHRFREVKFGDISSPREYPESACSHDNEETIWRLQ